MTNTSTPNDIFVPLNLPEAIAKSPLRKDFAWPTPYPDAKWDHFYFSNDVLSDEYHSWTKELGLETRSILMFYTAPYTNAPYVHVDGLKIHDYVAINWIFGGSESIMEWHTVKPEYESMLVEKAKYTKVGAPCILLEEEWCDVIAEYDMKVPAVFKNGIPHKINNRGHEPRWCVSVRFSIDLDEARERMKAYIT